MSADAESIFATNRAKLIDRLKALGFGATDHEPLVTLEEFFEGNTDYGSIGCNLTKHPGPQAFYLVLKTIRSKPGVQDVVVQVTDLNEGDDEFWPFSDRVYVFAEATPEQVSNWVVDLQPEPVEEGFGDFGTPPNAPALGPGVRVFTVWWD